MKLVKKSATKNILDNTKTVMDFADKILLPSQSDLSSWFTSLDIKIKAIFSIRFYIREIFELRAKQTDEENIKNTDINTIIDNIKSYFYEEKYLENEQWWNTENFQNSIIELAKYISDNPTYLQIYIEPNREMLYEIVAQEQCDASYVEINDLGAFAKLLTLKDLSLQDSNLSTLDGLEHLTYLKILNIKNNNITSMHPLRHMIQLQWLGISKNNISDISAISNMTMLEQLDLRWNNISDISAISNAKELKILFCGVNQIQSIEPLSGLSELLIIGCSKNNIQSIEPLRGLDKLMKILISDNNISNIDSLRNLKNIVSFDFRNNNISSIKSLLSYENIKNIGFDGNNIPHDEIQEFIATCDSCFIHSNEQVKEQQGI